MKCVVWSLVVLIGAVRVGWAQQDKEGCSDHPLLSGRVPGYYLADCEQNDFSSHTVTVKTSERMIEGRKTVLQYRLQSGAKARSEVFVRKNYVDAMVKHGGKQMHESKGRGVVHLRQTNGTETWLDVVGYVGEGTPEQSELYIVTIVEVAPMEQVITANGLATDLEQQGKSILYIQFDTGKATIKAESMPAIEQMAAALAGNPSLSVWIVGHTDNVGRFEDNLRLSEDRAKAVVAVLVSKHRIAENRVMARGVGPLSPIASNASDDGRKQNRRVEMVKQ